MNRVETPTRVLCYVRPWNAGYFRTLCEEAFGIGKTTYISDFRGVGDISLATRFYKNLQSPSRSIAFLSPAVRADIVTRCRLLRVLPGEKANRLVVGMAATIDEIFDSSRPDLIISMTVDSYVIDLLYHAARAKAIPFFGMCSFVMNGRWLVTSRGESNAFRRVSESEIDDAITFFENSGSSVSYLPDASKLLRLTVRRWLREVVKTVHFPLVRHWQRDPLNYHYLATQKAARDHLPFRHLFPRRYETNDWEAILKNRTRPIAYVPLQFHPECNTDYWCTASVINYEDRVPEVVRALSREFLVLIKEHPNMLGFRDPHLHERLAHIRNVHVVPVTVPSRELLRHCDIALTWSGSIGIEAAASGKPVITVGTPYYTGGSRFWDLVSMDDLPRLPAEARRLAEAPLAPIEERRAFLRRILSSTLPGVLWPDSFTSSRPANVDIHRTASAMRRALPEWFVWHYAKAH